MHHPLIDFTLKNRTGIPLGEVSDIVAYYDPQLQRIPTTRMGDSRPTTRSSVESTGVINKDGDDSADDEGKD